MLWRNLQVCWDIPRMTFNLHASNCQDRSPSIEDLHFRLTAHVRSKVYRKLLLMPGRLRIELGPDNQVRYMKYWKGSNFSVGSSEQCTGNGSYEHLCGESRHTKGILQNEFITSTASWLYSKDKHCYLPWFAKLKMLILSVGNPSFTTADQTGYGVLPFAYSIGNENLTLHKMCHFNRASESMRLKKYPEQWQANPCWDDGLYQSYEEWLLQV